ncbi:MAG: transketolase [Gammaproteobacteria bacterium]|nr:transketolase [Gammaproteobacteria bacterium]
MSLFQQSADALRALSIDAVNRANSGHAGMPMGMADIATVLWQEFFSHHPTDPKWWNRDRFILSNGHGSMLQYALLHLTGYEVSLDDLKNFRQLHAKTPGHPEYGETPGVETTTGPLGQGFANAVGMALAEKILAAEFNRPNFSIIDHFTYVFLGDGCLMEGISHEVASLAGTWQLNKLIVFWDDNGISIDGLVSGWFTDNTPERFRSYGWHVISSVDGHNPDDIRVAIANAQKEKDRPTLICCRTVIGLGSSLAGTAEAHGPLLGTDAQVAKEAIGYSGEPFDIPQDIYQAWDARKKGDELFSSWYELWLQYQEEYPSLAEELTRRKQGKFPENWSSIVNDFVKTAQESNKKMATRKASQFCINSLATVLPELIGGSADLSASNGTLWKNAHVFSSLCPQGHYLHYGVREFGMSAMSTGLALYGGFIPFCATFLTFSDYARHAVRMAAMMKQKVVFIYTHDSIGVGEDGPTHQPVEHIASLRLIPNLRVWRPCDVVEMAVAWQNAVEYQGPTALLCTRQDIAAQTYAETQVNDIARGGYILFEPKESVRVIVLATGSEVEIAMTVARRLSDVRVVSLPCVEVFLEQAKEYQESVLPSEITCRIAIEAGVSDGWYRFVGPMGKVIGLNEFGLSAPAEKLYHYFGLTADQLERFIRI